MPINALVRRSRTHHPRSYLADCYPRYVASIMASNDLFRSFVGAAFPLFSAGAHRRCIRSRAAPAHLSSLRAQLSSTISVLAPRLVLLAVLALPCFLSRSCCEYFWNI